RGRVRCLNATEQTVILKVVCTRDSGGEVEGVGIASVSAVAELQTPQSTNGDNHPARILHRAQVRSARQAISVDRPVTEISHEQCAAEISKLARRQGHSPG